MTSRECSYPAVEEIIHGVVVSDPYRWLEGRELPETEEWIREQGKRCEAYFSGCDTFGLLRCRVERYLNVEVVDQPARIGDRYIYRRRNEDQEQACIYVMDIETNQERLLVDPSGEGPFASVGVHRVSDDGSLAAYEVKRGGSDAKEIRIVDVSTGRMLPDQIGDGYARGFTFTSHNGGFYFCHESPSSGEDHRILYHGFSGNSVDRTVFRKLRAHGSRLLLTADTIHLGAMWIYEHEEKIVCDFYLACRERDEGWHEVFAGKTLPHTPMLYGGRIFVLSFEAAPNGKIIEVTPDGREARIVVPECESMIQQIVVASGRLFIGYLRNGHSSIEDWTMEGDHSSSMGFPGDGTIQLLPQLGSSERSVFYTHQSFTQPPAIYEYITGSGKSHLWSRPGPSFDPKGFQVQSHSFTAEDRTEIPITLIGRRAAQSLRPQPAIMTSYGGFGVPITPQFSVLVTIMLELGAVFVLPHIRGGGDLGKEWHDAGRGRNRQMAFDDFIRAAEWLCAEGVTSPEKLGIFGGSNSGLLVGAAMTQRPDLFGAVLCIAPLLDMVRYEHFDQAAKWRAEFGSVENNEDFHALHAYSPYHNVNGAANYPATLFVSGDKDDRCNPAHVRKMTARLQERAAQVNPILVDYSAERGHSPVLPLTVRIDALARRLAFLCQELGIEVPPEAFDEPTDC
jgi:prolyl oligopeptidase